MNKTKEKQIVKAYDLSFELYISEEDIKTKVQEMAAKITAKYKDLNPLIIAVLNGSFIFAADLTRACAMDCDISFVKLASYEGLKSTGDISTLIGLEQDVKDRHIIVVEDIVDTGNTIATFLPKLKELHPASVAVASLLLKPEPFNNLFTVDYIGFEIPNKFVIGYGLDYNGRARNLKGIYQLIETV